jgi:hypothetical protein
VQDVLDAPGLNEIRKAEWTFSRHDHWDSVRSGLETLSPYAAEGTLKQKTAVLEGALPTLNLGPRRGVSHSGSLASPCVSEFRTRWYAPSSSSARPSEPAPGVACWPTRGARAVVAGVPGERGAPAEPPASGGVAKQVGADRGAAAQSRVRHRVRHCLRSMAKRHSCRVPAPGPTGSSGSRRCQ